MKSIGPNSQSGGPRSIDPGSVRSRSAHLRTVGPRSVSSQPADLHSIGPRSVTPVSDDIYSLIAKGLWLQLAKLLESGEYFESVKLPSSKLEFPLHMAVDRKAPAFIIEALILEYPEAAAIMNLEGDYPLHSACQQRLQPAALYSLIRAYPDALEKKNKLGKTPSSFRQYDKTSNAYVSKPLCCWGNFISHQESHTIRLEKLEALKRQKICLQTEVGDFKCRLGIQRDIFREYQRISADFPERATIYSQLDKKMSKLERYSHEGISRLKQMMIIVNDGVKGEDSLVDSHKNQVKYPIEVTERLKLAERDLIESRQSLDDAKRCEELVS